MDYDGNVVAEEDADLFKRQSEFTSLEDKEIYNCNIHAINKLESMRGKKLAEMIHRLVDLTPYLWT